MSSAECQALHSLRFQSHRASTPTYAPLPLRECLIRHLRVLITLCGNEAGASNGWDRGSRIPYNHPRRKLTQSCRSDHSERLLRSKLVENGLLRNDHSCHAQCNTTSVMEKQIRRKRSKDGVAMESATPCSTCFGLVARATSSNTRNSRRHRLCTNSSTQYTIPGQSS